jgi:FKBP-type peptidyl-prolyl cis-trans isomerase FkpA
MRIFVIIFLLFSCTEKQNKEINDVKWSKENSVDLNKNLLLEEELDIQVFLASKPSWKTIKTGTGLRYYIYEKGSGLLAKPDMEAEVSYKINLLNGKLCYQTEEGETQKFKVDKSDVESGIQEGIKKMNEGDKARLIIPSHLAHGLIGDRDKIPPLTTIVVDIHLLKLK